MTNEITTRTIRNLMRGLDPITRKNLMSFTKDLPLPQTYSFIKNFMRNKGLSTNDGMATYLKKREGGCKGCQVKR